MKILVACHAGICRSNAMARELKRYGDDVIVAGLGYNAPETIHMLTEWADKIVVLQSELVDLVPADSREKVVVGDVGPDVWQDPSNLDLVARVKVIVDSWKKKGGWDFEHVSLRPKSR